MSTITTLNATDSGSTSRGVINTNFSNLNTDKKEQTDIDSSINTHKAVQTGVHGLAITSGKTLTVSDNATISGGTHSGSNTGDQTLPVKASGSEVDTGTDDAKFLTAKAVNDSHNVPMVAPGTSGNILTSNGTDWTSAAISTSFVVGDVLIKANDSGVAPAQDVWAKAKETQLGMFGGNLRIKFTLAAGDPSYWVEGQIYKNGSAVGTLRQNKTASGVEYSEDITGFVKGDYVQVYGQNVGGTSRAISNFRLYASAPEFITTIS